MKVTTNESKNYLKLYFLSDLDLTSSFGNHRPVAQNQQMNIVKWFPHYFRQTITEVNYFSDLQRQFLHLISKQIS